MTTHRPQRSSFSDEEQKLLDILPKQQEHDVGALAEALDTNAEEIIKIADSLSRKGYRIKFDVARNVLRLLTDGEDGEIKYPDVSDVLNHFKIGIIAETRIGAKQEQIRVLRGAYKKFAEIGVNFVIHAGNVFVGKSDSGSPLTSIRPDVFLFTAEEQRNFAYQHFPVVGKKIKTYMIAGRRDLTFRGKQSYSIVQDLCHRRSDLVYWGDKMRTCNVRGLKITIMNPYDDNGPQGKTYGVQQVADSLDDPHPDVLLVAGMHRYSWIPDYWNDGWGYVGMVPSLHAQMTRQSNKRAPVRPDVGIAVLDINLKELDAHGKPKILYSGYNLNQYADYSCNEHFEPYPQYNEQNLQPEEVRILQLVHEASEFGITVGEITRRTKINRGKVEEVVGHLQELGYPISIPEDIKRVVIQQKLRDNFPPVDFDVAREVEVGVVSDTHLTSTHQQIGLLNRAYDIFDKRGVCHVFHGGDLSEGAPSAGYPGHARDVEGGNIDTLLEYVIEKYPTLAVPKNKTCSVCGKTIAISGNHDNWILSRGGLDFVQAFAKSRPDIEYLGQEYGSIVVDGVYYYLLHPRGGSGDTLSRKLEMHIRRARNRASKGKGYPRVFFLGNWHVAIAFFDRDILGFLVPCMKREDVFHASLGLVPKLGFWIVKLGLDAKDNILSFTPEYFGFSEEDIDPWDYTDIHQWEIERAEKEREKVQRLPNLGTG